MDADEIFVRTYEDPDREAVVALWTVVFPNDPPWNEPVIFIRLKRSIQPQLFWVAEEGDQIIGTVVAGYDGVRGGSTISPSTPPNGEGERHVASCKRRKAH